MRHLTRFQVDGYKRLDKFNLVLSDLTVLIGQNAVGKSTVLDTLAFLSEATSGYLPDALKKRGGLQNTISTSRFGRITFRPTYTINNKTIVYEISFDRSFIGRQILKEQISELINGKSKILVDYRKHHETKTDVLEASQETFLSRVSLPLRLSLPLLQGLSGEDIEPSVKASLLYIYYYHAIEIGTHSPIRLQQTLQPSRTPGTNGEDLISCLFSLDQNDRDRYRLLEDTFRSGFPDFDRFEFPLAGAGVASLAMKDRRFDRSLFANQWSDGMLRFLWLITILITAPPGLIMIDEPEIGLHPELLALLVDLMREAAIDSQILIATQSDALVRFLKPHELAVMDLNEDGTATVVNATDLSIDLEKWLDEFSLSDLWRMGRLGGRS